MNPYKNKKNNTNTWPIAALLMLTSPFAVASNGCGGGSGSNSGGNAEASTIDVELRGITRNSADIVVDCTVEYTADIGGDAAQKEGVVRKIVQDYSNATILRLTLQAMWDDETLLGRELKQDVSEVVEQTPQTRGLFTFDIVCDTPELAHPAG